MIVQGSNDPIRITFDSEPADVSVTIGNEIRIFKSWSFEDLNRDMDEEGYTYEAPIYQEESLDFDEGPCVIEVKWTELGNVQFARVRELIAYSDNREILTEWPAPIESGEEYYEEEEVITPLS